MNRPMQHVAIDFYLRAQPLKGFPSNGYIRLCLLHQPYPLLSKKRKTLPRLSIMP